ncbi:hypothetical protein LOD99_9582 [Oopsacas minuta]|uniref:Uncharacterized protein n=1 Tax=Oopsacas minuta TaxID=111878 RepID=A0AAV7KMD4_9METZ|nr:hypothetical protein LOD99_9582 [Oopsacas minuta]
MTLSDQIALGQQKINVLLEGMQELNEERLMQEETNTLMAITQTFDLLIQILVERKENLLLETKAIYEEAFASVYQRRIDVQSMIENIKKLEEESNTATNKPLFQAETEISCLKKKYEDVLLAVDEQLADIKNPVCSFELEQDTFLRGLLDLSNQVEEINKKESFPKRTLCKSHSQSINNDNNDSLEVESDRPNTAGNHIGSDTPTLSSPDKKHKLPLTMREYTREPNSHNRSTPTLDRIPYKDNYYDKNGGRDNLTYAVNGDAPFIRKSIPSDKLVIQTNYPNTTFQDNFRSPQLPKKNISAKSHKVLKKLNGEMEGGAVGMGVRRINSCDTSEVTDFNKLQKYRQRENYARKEPLRKLQSQDSIDSGEGNGNASGHTKRRNSKSLLQSYKSKKDSKSVGDMVRTLSLNSKQKIRLPEVNI